MRGFILLTLQKYGPHSRDELESDCKSVGHREPFIEKESFDDAIAGLLRGGMISQNGDVLSPVYSREKRREVEESKQAALFD